MTSRYHAAGRKISEGMAGGSPGRGDQWRRVPRLTRPIEHLVWRFAGATTAAAAPAGVVLRPWSEADSAAVGHVAAAVANRWPRPAGPSAAGWAAELRSRPGRTVQAWMAWEASAAGRELPRGFVTLVTTAAAAGTRHAIGWLVVDPAARRRGIGTALLAEALGQARGHGAEAVWVETAAAWAEAAGFWRSAGFEPARRDGLL